MRAERYRIADKYPKNFGPNSSAIEEGSEPRGWFSEDSAHPSSPAAMTTAIAPMYWKTILTRVAGDASTNEVRRRRRGVDSLFSRAEREDNLRWPSGCFRKYRIWKIRVTSERIKYADMMTMDGSRPPQIALWSAYVQATVIPYEGEDVAEQPNNDEVKSQGIASNELDFADHGSMRFCSIVLDNLRHQHDDPAG